MEHIRRKWVRRFNVTKPVRCVRKAPVAVTHCRRRVKSDCRRGAGRARVVIPSRRNQQFAICQRGSIVQGVRVCCLLSTLLLALSACASRAVKETPVSSATLAAHGIECHKERATGSLVEAMVCTSPAQRTRAADDAQKTKDWMHTVPAGPCMPVEACH